MLPDEKDELSFFLPFAVNEEKEAERGFYPGDAALSPCAMSFLQCNCVQVQLRACDLDFSNSITEISHLHCLRKGHNIQYTRHVSLECLTKHCSDIEPPIRDRRYDKLVICHTMASE